MRMLLLPSPLKLAFLRLCNGWNVKCEIAPLDKQSMTNGSTGIGQSSAAAGEDLG